MAKISRALISVSDKTGAVEFARELAKRGVEILSTGGTSEALRTAGIAVVDVAHYTGSPEILGGRLKTLHPKIHGGILGRRNDPKHLKEMKENSIDAIDMVVVNLYPFEGAIAKPNCTFDTAIENIDIGGPAMLRSAAKNHAFVAVVCDPKDYDAVIAEMDANGREISSETRLRLAMKAFGMTARYDCAIQNYLRAVSSSQGETAWPESAAFSFEKTQDLRYGENPHQRAAFYRDVPPLPEPCVANAKQIQGKEISCNNIMDADAAIEIVKEFPETQNAAVIVKHTNPCGVAVSDKSLVDAYDKALASDPTSAFGGIIGFNRAVDPKTAGKISETFYEVIAAPGFDGGAIEILSKKKNLRLLEIPGLGKNFTPSGFSFRKVVGGLLLQNRDTIREDLRRAKVVTLRAPTEDEWAALEFAWRVCKRVKSNAIVFATKGATLGIGAGQTSRVDSVRIAAQKMKSVASDERRATSDLIVVASDAFFPFRDGIDVAHTAGATAVIEPGGSVRDEEVIATANEHNMAMVFTGVRHFRH